MCRAVRRTDNANPSVPFAAPRGLFAYRQEKEMYFSLPAETISGAIQHLVYFFTVLAVIFGWILTPR